ncbi:MAG TPA: hypothetical protein VGE95_04650, partial [Arthrobacter sp.]
EGRGDGFRVCFRSAHRSGQPCRDLLSASASPAGKESHRAGGGLHRLVHAVADPVHGRAA